MAQNAYSSNINSSSIVGRESKKRVHYRDDPDTKSNSDKYEQTKAREENELPFYPAFCFPASPTHFTWVKMSIADIHRLQSRRGFEGTTPHLSNFFYLHSDDIQARIYTSTKTTPSNSSVWPVTSSRATNTSAAPCSR